MATLATLIALTALLYLMVRSDNSAPRMEPIRIRDDEAQQRQRQRRR